MSLGFQVCAHPSEKDPVQSVFIVIVSSVRVLLVRQEEAAVSRSAAKEMGVDAALSELDNITFSAECFPR